MNKIGMLKVFQSDEINESSVSIGFECLDRDLFKAEKCYDPLAATGVKYARVQTGWNKCETEKGIYDFTWLDGIVNNLCSRGIRPWLSVSFGNPIYMPNVPNPTGVGCVPLYYGEETQAAWLNFARTVAERYRDRVTNFEIWNEPDIKSFWYPEKPSGKEYARLVKLTGDAIRSTYPEAKIGAVMAGARRLDYLSDLLEYLSPYGLNFFCYHIYTTVPEFRHFELVRQIRRMLDHWGLQQTEIWQGEGGYPSWAYEGHWLVHEGCDDERPQAIWQLRRYFLDMAAGVKMSSFFQMADIWEKPYAKATEVIQRAAAHGILHGLVYTPKESYRTISHLASVFSEGTKAADLYMLVDTDDPSVMSLLACQSLTFEKHGTPVYAYYLPTPVAEHVEIPYTASVEVADAPEDPVLIDMYTGDVYDLSENTEQSEGKTVYKDLPLKDYPMVIAGRKTFAIC